MSRRLAECVRRYRNRAHVLIPPVPSEYSRREGDKGGDGKIVVAYIGRLEGGKGALEAVEILEELAGYNDIEARVLAYRCGESAEARELRDRIAGNDRIRYKERTHVGWAGSIEEEMARELGEIDILLLPYRRVNSSIDTPLLLLEGMASLCCCMVRGGGDISEVYGRSPFLIEARSDGDFVKRACELIRGGGWGMVRKERARLVDRRRHVACDTASVTDGLIRILEQAK